jgi:orotate phosphoribosyltransferase
MNRDSLAQALYAAAHREGEFMLRSGRITTEYFDKYRFESDPRLLRRVAEALAPLVPGVVRSLAWGSSSLKTLSRLAVKSC